MATFEIASTPCHQTSSRPVALGFHSSTSSPAGRAQRTTSAYLLTLSSDRTPFLQQVLLRGCWLRKRQQKPGPIPWSALPFA
uniref:Uncharacterized protein n=1 Tax=Hyaloperonospora arabidopsidis (strain Emoy2) TaxID=559515 RepID=M4B5E3_HYAAE